MRSYWILTGRLPVSLPLQFCCPKLYEIVLTYLLVSIVEFVVPIVANAGSVTGILTVVVAVLRIDTIDVVEPVLRKD